MPLEYDLERTVAGLVRAHGPHAADEAKQMWDRKSRRKNPSGSDFWRRVYLALCADLPGRRGAETVEGHPVP